MTSPPTPPTASDPGASSQVVPTCYRHPDRETYIRCSRCERHICTDCMRDAAVGFQCPECVAEGARSQRAPRRVYRAPTGASGAPVTVSLIAVTVVVFVLQYTGWQLQARGSTFAPAIADGQYYRLVTALFLHTGLLHIGFNMYLLYLLGAALERPLGPWRFLALYLAAGLGGSAASYVADQNGIGASGAVFGLFSAYWIFARSRRMDTSQITVLIVINLVLSFVVPGIGYWAHLGGLVSGAVIGVAYAAPVRRGAARLLVQAAGPALVLAVAGAAVAVHTATLTGG